MNLIVGVLPFLVAALATASDHVLLLAGEKLATSKLQSYLNENYGKVSVSKKSTKLMSESGPLYSHLLLLSSAMPYEKELVEFMEKGGNVLWALDASTTGQLSAKTRNTAKELGRIFEAEAKLVTDHFSNHSGDKHLVRAQAGKVIEDGGSPIHFKGFSHKIEKSNPLLFPILTASETASSNNGLSGRDNILASGLTARNGARSTVIGSTDSFTDSSFDRSLAAQLVSWTFGKSGVQKISSITAKILSNEVDYFRIRDDFAVEVCLSQLGNNGHWEPFLPVDAQVELTMMTTWIRATLKPDHSTGCLSTGPIQLPDRYGAYSIFFRYQRHGQTHLVHKEQLTVFPYKYDTTPRFATVHWPYYAAWISQMACSLLIVLPALIHNRLVSAKKSD